VVIIHISDLSMRELRVFTGQSESGFRSTYHSDYFGESILDLLLTDGLGKIFQSTHSDVRVMIIVKINKLTT
jgi:hypothetical protein